MSARPAGARHALLCLGLCFAALACADEPSSLVVGTSGDYAPFSMADAAGEPTGFDPDLVRAFARDAGLALRFARFAWPELSRDVVARRFDVAMGGVTVRPERSVIGRFGVPVAESGAVVLVPSRRAEAGLAGLDRPGVRIAVNAGGHLERVARRTFPRAELEPLPENDAVRRSLAAGTVDAAVTDTLEAPHWERTLAGVVRLGPFTRDRKAALWALGSEARAEAFDVWLLAREADGTLAEWRRVHLGAAGRPTATPLGALLAAVGERLALMPAVAEAKRTSGRAVRDPARERRVLDAARAAVAARAAEVGVRPPADVHVDAFYRAQIEAAVAIQQQVLAGPAPADPPGLDLADELRPALLRIGDRMAWALVRIARVPEAGALHSAVGAELASAGLGADHAGPLVEAIDALAQSLVAARASSPAITGSTSETP